MAISAIAKGGSAIWRCGFMTTLSCGAGLLTRVYWTKVKVPLSPQRLGSCGYKLGSRPLGPKETDGLLVRPGKAYTLLTDHLIWCYCTADLRLGFY